MIPQTPATSAGPSRRAVLRGAGLLGAAAVAGPALAACSSSSPSAGSGGSNTGSITFWHWEPSFQAPFAKAIASYEAAHPGVKVTQRMIPFGPYSSALQAALVGGNPPDIFFPEVLTLSLAKAGQTLDLKKELGSNFISQFYPSDNAQSVYQGGQYGVPWISQIFLLYYNKKILAAAGVNPPQTWADVRQIAPIIRSKTGAIPLAVQGNPNNVLADFMLPMVTQAGNDPSEVLKLDALTAPGATWETPNVVAAFQNIIELVNGKVFDPGVLAATQDGAYASYTSGKAAMLFSGSFFLPVLHTTATQSFIANEFAFTKLPAWSPGARHWAGDQAGDVLAVSSKSKSPQVALDFIKYLYQPQRYVAMCNQTANMPSTVAGGPQISDPNLRKMASWLAAGDGCPHILFGQGSFAAVSNTTTAVFQGKYTASQAAAAVQSSVTQARQQS
jgi:ABC-type glycerol-3-phosphate transport system substrate-binding protein